MKLIGIFCIVTLFATVYAALDERMARREEYEACMDMCLADDDDFPPPTEKRCARICKE